MSADDSKVAHATLATPLVHPSWWPSLPLSLLIGLVMGVGAWALLRQADFAIFRRSQDDG